MGRRMKPIAHYSIRSGPISISRERGVVLFIALIALVAMTLAAIGLVRSHETGSMIAGNVAFKQGTIQNADTAIETAITAMAAFLPVSQEQDIANQYFATAQPENALGVPTTINWTTVPCRDAAGAAIACSSAGAYRMQYVVDRLCQGPLPVYDSDTNCVSSGGTGGSSKKANAPQITDKGMVYYRITTRTQGPRDTTSLVQAIVGFKR